MYTNALSTQIDQTLRQEALTYELNTDNKLVHDKVCARVEADVETSKVLIEDPEWMARLPALTDITNAKSGDVEPLMLERQLGTKNVTMSYLKFAMPVTKRDIDNFRRKIPGTANVVDPKISAMRRLVNMAKGIKEKHFITTINTSGSYKTGHAFSLSAGDRWDEAANDPGEDFQTYADALQLGGGGLTDLIANPYALQRIYNNPYIKSRMHGSITSAVQVASPLADQAFAAAYLNGGKVYRADGIYHVGEKGASSPTGLTRMIKDDVIFCHNSLDTTGLAPGEAPRTFMTMLVDPEVQMLLYTVPFRWGRGGEVDGYYVVLEDSFGLFYAPDTVSNNKINLGVLVQDCVS